MMDNELHITVTDEGMKVRLWITDGLLTPETLEHLKAVIAEARRRPPVERRQA